MMGFNLILPTLDQRDRIEGMARFMNTSGSSTEFMTLLYIVGGFLILLMILKSLKANQEAKSNKKTHKK